MSFSEFQWNVEHFNQRLDVCCGATIESPVIAFGHPRHTLGKICLKSTHSPNIFVWEFIQLVGESRGECTVTFLNSEHVPSIHFPFAGASTQVNVTRTHVPKDIFQMHVNTIFDEHPYDMDLLANQMSAIFKHPSFYDLTLQGHTRDCMVHRYILAQRAPEMLTILEASPHVAKEWPFSTFATLLNYVYSGHLPSHALYDMIPLAHRYFLKEPRLLEMTTEIVAADSVKTIHSHNTTIFRHVTFDMRGTRVAHTLHMGSSRFLIRWQDHGQGIKVQFQKLSLEEKVHLHCRTTYADTESSFQFCFTPDSPTYDWYVHKRTRDTLVCQCSVLSHDFDTVDGDIKAVTSEVGKHALRKDMETLFEQTQKLGNGDVTLVCDGQSLYAHKAILAAWSGMCQDLFLNKKETRVFHLNVQYNVCRALVRYMYTGRYLKPDQDEERVEEAILKFAFHPSVRRTWKCETSIGHNVKDE